MQKILKSVEEFQSNDFVLPLFHILRVHYEWEMDCFILQGRISILFRLGGHILFTYVCNVSSCLQQCKNYKNRMRFSRVMITNALPPFSVHSVDSSNEAKATAAAAAADAASLTSVERCIATHPLHGPEKARRRQTGDGTHPVDTVFVSAQGQQEQGQRGEGTRCHHRRLRLRYVVLSQVRAA